MGMLGLLMVANATFMFGRDRIFFFFFFFNGGWCYYLGFPFGLLMVADDIGQLVATKEFYFIYLFIFFFLVDHAMWFGWLWIGFGFWDGLLLGKWSIQH